MKLDLNGINKKDQWTGYRLPGYDIKNMCAVTKKNPVWLHFGSGNLFRAFLCVSAQRLLDANITDTGIICAESHDEEIITKCYHPHDNLSVVVTLCPDGSMDKEVVASVAESLTTARNISRIEDIICSPSLQLVSFTITEKGYSLRDAAGSLLKVIEQDMSADPSDCRHLMSLLASMCLKRFHSCKKPLALVSMDNCSHNSARIESAFREIAGAWKNNGFIDSEEYDYLTSSLTFPWTMIDKITPRPDSFVEKQLASDGIEDISAFVTSSGVYIAPFVNAEKPQYLVIEDNFPNGRPPLEKAGILFADRDTVDKMERMKVSTCLNPLHTVLAVFGCLLGYTSIAEEMKDNALSSFIRRMAYEEGLPVVVDPGIIKPEEFLEEVLTERFPNPYIPDTPQRIASDTSQKLPVRFGETIKVHAANGSVDTLSLIPLLLAGWLRYLIGVNDDGIPFELSPDPLLPELKKQLCGISLGECVDYERLMPLLSNETIFGVDLCKMGLGKKVTGYFNELLAGPGAVRATIEKYTAF